LLRLGVTAILVGFKLWDLSTKPTMSRYSFSQEASTLQSLSSMRSLVFGRALTSGTCLLPPSPDVAHGTGGKLFGGPAPLDPVHHKPSDGRVSLLLSRVGFAFEGDLQLTFWNGNLRVSAKPALEMLQAELGKSGPDSSQFSSSGDLEVHLIFDELTRGLVVVERCNGRAVDSDVRALASHTWLSSNWLPFPLRYSRHLIDLLSGCRGFEPWSGLPLSERQRPLFVAVWALEAKESASAVPLVSASWTLNLHGSRFTTNIRIRKTYRCYQFDSMLQSEHESHEFQSKE